MIRYYNPETNVYVNAEGSYRLYDWLEARGYRTEMQSASDVLSGKKEKTENGGVQVAREKKPTSFTEGQAGTKTVKGVIVSYVVKDGKFNGTYRFQGQEITLVAKTFESLVSSVSHKIAKLAGTVPTERITSKEPVNATEGPSNSTGSVDPATD